MNNEGGGKTRRNFFSFLPVFEVCFPFEKRAAIPWDYRRVNNRGDYTGRGNREVHAVQPRRGQTPRRGVLFGEVGRRRFLLLPSYFSLFFPVTAEKSKIYSRWETPRRRGPRRKNNGEGKRCERNKEPRKSTEEIAAGEVSLTIKK